MQSACDSAVRVPSHLLLTCMTLCVMESVKSSAEATNCVVLLVLGRTGNSSGASAFTCAAR